MQFDGHNSEGSPAHSYTEQQHDELVKEKEDAVAEAREKYSREVYALQNHLNKQLTVQTEKEMQVSNTTLYLRSSYPALKNICYLTILNYNPTVVLLCQNDIVHSPTLHIFSTRANSPRFLGFL